MILALASLLVAMFATAPAVAQVEGFPGKPAGVDSVQWRELQLAVSASLGTPHKLTGVRSAFGSDGEGGDRVGFSVALDDATAVVGAYGDNVGATYDQGSAYVFVAGPSGWSMQQKLTLADGKDSDHFGFAVALQGDTLVISAPNRDADNAFDVGSAYVYTRAGGIWSPQQTLVAAAAEPGGYFGTAVALDGGTALLASAGGAYVFDRTGTTWSETAYLAASGAGYFNLAASPVALRGAVALIGAPFETIGDNPGQGAVYAFRRDGGNWGTSTRLVAPDGEAQDAFGKSVAVDGVRILVGAPKDDLGTPFINDSGSAHMFVQAGTSWVHEQQIFGSVESHVELEFGSSVAVEGGLAVVGTPRGYDFVSHRGKAFVFRNLSGTWTQQQVLRSSTGAADHIFGSAMALDGERLLVGAPGNLDTRGSATSFVLREEGFVEDGTLSTGIGGQDNRFGFAVDVDGATAIVGAPGQAIGSNAQQGAAFVFVRNGPRWVLQQKLWAADGNDYEEFGSSVAIDGETVLIGALKGREVDTHTQGAAYVFRRTGQAWSLQQKLLASDISVAEQFGVAAALEGDTALVGANHEGSFPGVNEGAAYVFVRNGTHWTEQQKLMAADRSAGDFFGGSVSLSGETAMIGALGKDEGERQDRGAAYVFGRQQGTWIQQQKLLAVDGATYTRFGTSVAVDRDFAVVGTGAHAYVFSRATGVFAPYGKLFGSGVSASGFGSTVSLSGSKLLVGAPYERVSGDYQGAAYLYSLTGPAWDIGSRIVAADGNAEQSFGSSVALDGETTLVGAYGDTSPLPYGSEDEGAAYLYEGSAFRLPSSNNLFDSRRDGHGIDFSWVRDNVYALTFYTYGADGEPEWFQAVGSVTSGVFTAIADANGKSLMRYRYTAGNTPPQTPVSAQSGTVALDFNSPSTKAPCNDGRPSANAVAVMTFTLGANQNVRWCMEPIVAATARPPINFSGLWFAGNADDGWGWSVLHFTAGAVTSTYGLLFYYDALGNPVWSYSLHNGVSANTATPLVHRRAYCRSCATTAFTDRNAGSVTFGFTTPSESPAANNRVDYESTPQNAVGGRFARTNSPFILLTTPQ